jgi:hypothetical protein
VSVRGDALKDYFLLTLENAHLINGVKSYLLDAP